MTRALVTGATGFVGRAFVSSARGAGYRVTRALREKGQEAVGTEDVVIGSIGPGTEWGRALEEVEVVVHLAARVHVMRERAADPDAAFREVNTLGTERLARSAAAAGVRRLVYLSSVKVQGERTEGRPFRESDPPSPADPYARSKLAAEEVLASVAAATGLEVVIIRPPLVYGPGAGGNFARLVRLIGWGFPLPLGGLENQRSLVSLDNLCDLMLHCLTHPGAAGGTFLLSDGRDLSTPELITLLGTGLGRRPRLFRFPLVPLEILARGTGHLEEWRRLADSLQVDITRARERLGWVPPRSCEEALAAAAASFRNR